MKMKKGHGGLRLSEENMVRKRESSILVFQGRDLGCVGGKF